MEPDVVSAGLNSHAKALGLSGLSPFEILEPTPVRLRPAPGVLRIWIDLPAGVQLDPTSPLAYRVFGGEAGLEFERGGQIVRRGDAGMPIELAYEPRGYPAPPAAGQLALDLTFVHRDAAGTRRIQDVQWRQVVVWDARGADRIEWRFSLPGR